MKMPNGYGCVYKLSGKRRKPWAVIITEGYERDSSTGKAKQKRRVLGTYTKRDEALTALSNFNENPYDLDTKNITFSEVYEKWSDGYFQKISPSSVRTVTSAYTRFAPLYELPFASIRVTHLEDCIKNADASDNIKARMKSILNLLYKFALKNDIVDVDYAARCDSFSKATVEHEHVPFTPEEEAKLWENLDIPFTDMVLIGIYTGFRPQELSILKIADVDLDQHTLRGGMKTAAGTNRIVPIHSKIYDLVKKNYDRALALGSEHLFNDLNGQQGTFMTYDKYRSRFNKVCKALALEHRPHDTRHTFITKAKAANVNEYILKLIVGHSIKDITEAVYTHRTLEQMCSEIEKIK